MLPVENRQVSRERIPKMAYQRDETKVEEWTNTTFRKKLKEQAEEEGGEIYLCDESEIYTLNVYGKSYSPKGKTPVIKTTGSRLKMNVISSYLMMVL
ncbi:MAG: hypothetical protein LBF22_00350 [Deltaproteobacteria bacterium]|nr:hypothetical protein [Deltaproteobacteria bacterium]